MTVSQPNTVFPHGPRSSGAQPASTFSSPYDCRNEAPSTVQEAQMFCQTRQDGTSVGRSALPTEGIMHRLNTPIFSIIARMFISTPTPRGNINSCSPTIAKLSAQEYRPFRACSSSTPSARASPLSPHLCCSDSRVVALVHSDEK
jgi:hypothetical protein